MRRSGGRVRASTRGEPAALVGDVVAVAQPHEGLGELLEAVDPLAHGQRGERDDVGVEVAAGADAEQEPAVADVLERLRVAEEQVGVPEVGRDDEGAEPDGLVTWAAAPSTGVAVVHGESGRPPHTRWS